MAEDLNLSVQRTEILIHSFSSVCRLHTSSCVMKPHPRIRSQSGPSSEAGWSRVQVVRMWWTVSGSPLLFVRPHFFLDSQKQLSPQWRRLRRNPSAIFWKTGLEENVPQKQTLLFPAFSNVFEGARSIKAAVFWVLYIKWMAPLLLKSSHQFYQLKTHKNTRRLSWIRSKILIIKNPHWLDGDFCFLKVFLWTRSWPMAWSLSSNLCDTGLDSFLSCVAQTNPDCLFMALYFSSF